MLSFLYKNTLFAGFISFLIFGLIIWQNSDLNIALDPRYMSTQWMYVIFDINGSGLKVSFFILLALIGLMLSILMSSLKIYNNFTLLPTLLFYVALSFFKRFDIHVSSIFPTFLMLISFFVIERMLYHKIKSKYFYIFGILLGMTFLLDFQSVFYILILLVIINQFSSRELLDLVATMLGLLLVFYVVFSLLYIFDSKHTIGTYFSQFSTIKIHKHIAKYLYFTIFYIIVWILYSSHSIMLSINNRNMYLTFFIYFLCSILYAALYSTEAGSSALPMVMVGSIFLSTYFYLSKSKRFNNIMITMISIGYIINLIL